MTLHESCPSMSARSMVRVAMQAFEPAPEELLAARALQQRREWKLPVHLRTVPAVLRALAATHAVVMSGRTALARYRTTYLDTDRLRCFHDHRRGRPHRVKVRIRDYLDRRLTRLEVKVRKPRGHTDKHVAWRPFGHLAFDASDRAFAQQHVPWRIRELRRILEIHVHRITLVGVSQDERITVDCGVCWVGGTRRVDRSELAVIEVKNGSRAGAEPTLRALARLGIRPFGGSKYALGVAQLRSDVRCHRLRPALRRLARLAPTGDP